MKIKTDITLKFVHKKIIPPPEWSASSKNVDDTETLTSVTKQIAKKLCAGASELSTETVEMTHAEFKRLATHPDRNFDGQSIDQIEELHWSENCTSSSN